MKNKRRNYLINKRYQGRFIGLFMAVCITGVAVTTATMLYYIHVGLESKLYRTHIDISSTGDVVLPVALQVNLAFFLLGVFVIALLSMHYDRKADRMALGMVEGLRKLKDGQLDFQVEVGHKDEFPRLEESLNHMIRANRERLAEVARAVEKVEEAAGPLEGFDRLDPAVREAALRKIKLKAGALKRSLKVFTIERLDS